MEGLYFNIIKAIYAHPIANIILSGEKLKVFPPDREQDKYHLLPLWFRMVVEVLAREIRKEKEIKDIYIGKGRSKTVTTCRWHTKYRKP